LNIKDAKNETNIKYFSDQLIFKQEKGALKTGNKCYFYTEKNHLL